jgi:peroxiredoxin Q/BCP
MRARQRLVHIVCVGILWALTASAAGQLKIGDSAPEFSLPGSDGKVYRLSGYKGKQVVVLAWFTKAYTTP